MVARVTRIANYFKGVNYPDVESLLTHVDSISSQITPRAKVLKSTPLSPFAVKVKKLAPRFLEGQYQTRQMAEHLLRSTGKPVNAITLGEMKRRVANAVLVLRRRGELTATTRQDRPLRSAIETATSEDITRHNGLIQIVLAGKTYSISRIIRGWTRHLSKEDAFAAGQRGVKRAIELYRRTHPDKATFATYAVYHIANEVKSEMKRRQHLASLDEKSGIAGKTLHETLPSNGFETSTKLSDDLDLSFHSKAFKPHELAIWALRNRCGHTPTELSVHFGVSKQAIAGYNRIFSDKLNLLKQGKVLPLAVRPPRVKLPVYGPKNQRGRKMAPFTLEVAEVAPRFLHGQYQLTELAIEMLKRQGYENSTPADVRKMSSRVAYALHTLKLKNMVPASDFTGTRERHKYAKAKREKEK